MTGQNTRDDFRLSRLEFSQTEVENIAALFRKTRCDLYTGEMASEARLKKSNLADYRVVHFATHSLIDNRFPARSSIVLSLKNPSPEDGFLQMREVLGLKMLSDLVVLSACQTGLGRFIEGEGIDGISRAFLFAGASSVLMTLWAVNDQASYQFMHRFYTFLKMADGVEVALRRAKLEMIDSNSLSHPFYWAGFVVSGAGDKVLFSRSRRNWAYPLLMVLVLVIGFMLYQQLPAKGSRRSKSRQS